MDEQPLLALGPLSLTTDPVSSWLGTPGIGCEELEWIWGASQVGLCLHSLPGEEGWVWGPFLQAASLLFSRFLLEPTRHVDRGPRLWHSLRFTFKHPSGIQGLAD